MIESRGDTKQQLLVPPIIMPVLSADGGPLDLGRISLYEQRIMVVVENIKQAADLPATGSGAYNGERMQSNWHVVLPVERYGYDDSRDYNKARHLYAWPNEPFSHAPPVGMMGLNHWALAQVFTVRAPHWQCHDYDVDRLRRSQQQYRVRQAEKNVRRFNQQRGPGNYRGGRPQRQQIAQEQRGERNDAQQADPWD